MEAAPTVEVAVAPIAIPTDDAAIERGGYLYASRGCATSPRQRRRGEDRNEGGFSKAPHISAGDGAAAYKPEDWVRRSATA